MTALFADSESIGQAATSASVRRHPRQRSTSASNSQIPMQGESDSFNCERFSHSEAQV